MKEQQMEKKQEPGRKIRRKEVNTGKKRKREE